MYSCLPATSTYDRIVFEQRGHIVVRVEEGITAQVSAGSESVSKKASLSQ